MPTPLFELSSFSSFNIGGGAKFQKWVMRFGMTSFDLILQFCILFQSLVCMSSLTRIASSMIDILLFYDFANLAGKYPFVPILRSWGGVVHPLNCEIVVLTAKLRTSLRGKRFEVLRVQIGLVQISALREKKKSYWRRSFCYVTRSCAFSVQSWLVKITLQKRHRILSHSK